MALAMRSSSSFMSLAHATAGAIASPRLRAHHFVADDNGIDHFLTGRVQCLADGERRRDEIAVVRRVVEVDAGAPWRC